MATTLTRQELYDLVWSKPISQLVDHFGVSGVSIANACDRAHVPVPPRGWWARQAARKSSAVQIPLDPRPPGLRDTVSVGGGRDTWYSRDYVTDQEVLDTPIPPEPTFEESIDAVRERVSVMVGKVSGPRAMTNPHPVVARLLEQDEGRCEKQRRAGYISTWNAPLFDSPVGRRRLRFMSALFSVLSCCGCRVDGKAPEGRLFTILVGHQHVRVAFPVEEVRTRKGARSGAGPGVEKRLGFVLGVAHDGSGKGAHSWDDGNGSAGEPGSGHRRAVDRPR